MSDFSGLSRKLRAASQAVKINSDQLVRTVAKQVLKTVVEDTPVDSGKAKSNWQVNIGSAAEGVIDPHVPGKKGSTAQENTDATIAAGNERIDQYVTGQDIHITNNVPYIRDLNDGASNQAPPGFVEIAVIEAVEYSKQEGYIISHNIRDLP